MLWTLIRREILAHVLSLRFTVTFALFILLLFTGIFVTVNTHQQDMAEYDARVRANRNRLADILAEAESSRAVSRLFWHEGQQHAIPVAPLGWLGQGLIAAQPAAINTVAGGVRSVDRGLTRNPLLGMVRVPDFVYMVKAILSLLAILFMFDAVCGEKETGTLRLVLSNAVPRHTLLLGKWIAGYLVLMIPFLIAVVGGLGYAWVRGVFGPLSADAGRVLAMLAVAALYIAVFFNISLFISAATARSATALLIGLLVWVAGIIVIPNLGPVTARILRPAPSRKSVEVAKRAIGQEIDLRLQRLTLTSGELSYGVSVEQARNELEMERARRQRELDAYARTRQDGQIELAQTLGRLSPAASWTYAAVSLTGTGPDAYMRFLQARDSLENRFSAFATDIRQQARRTGWREWPTIRPDDLPALRPNLPDTAEAMAGALNDVLILTIMGVVFFMLAFVFFLRSDL